MTDFYRFPAMAELDEYTLEDQVKKVREEAEELVKVEGCGNSYYEQDFEAMDVIHAAESYLRMRHHSPETLEMLRQLVIEKNRKRGYYDD